VLVQSKSSCIGICERVQKVHSPLSVSPSEVYYNLRLKHCQHIISNKSMKYYQIHRTKIQRTQKKKMLLLVYTVNQIVISINDIK